MSYRSLLAAAAAVVSVAATANAQAPACADVAGKYAGFFKGATKVLLEIEPACKLTLNTSGGAGTATGARNNGHLVGKSTGWDFDLMPKDGKLVGVFNYGTTSDKNISFSKI